MNARDLAIAVAAGGPVRPSNGSFMVRCPAHEDATPSLSIADGADGTLVHCFAGCPPEAVLMGSGLVWADLSGSTEDRLPVEAAWTIYSYTDEHNKPLFQVIRKPDKQFRQRTSDPTTKTGYRWNLAGVRRVLYHLPEVIEAGNLGHEVWITEGEKDAECVRAHQVTATTSPGGAGKWQPEYAEAMTDGQVTVWADADEPGRVHAREVRESLLSVGARVRIVESAYGKDAYDHLSHGLTLTDVLTTVPYDDPEVESLFLSADAYISQESVLDGWVINTLLRHGEVVMLTGYEGWGKSSLLKQIAVCAAIGYHPFALMPVGDPARVLYIDCENTATDNIQDFTRLITQAKSESAWHDPILFIKDRGEMNLAKTVDLAWLMERVNAHRPDLLVIGPVYDLIGGDIAREETAQALKRAINVIRQRYGCAVVLEHHSPHRAAGEKEREVRPIGSSLLLRWPSFGFGLLPTTDLMKDPFEFYPWRGARRRGRSWPEEVIQTNGWFWRQTC